MLHSNVDEFYYIFSDHVMPFDAKEKNLIFINTMWMKLLTLLLESLIKCLRGESKKLWKTPSGVFPFETLWSKIKVESLIWQKWATIWHNPQTTIQLCTRLKLVSIKCARQERLDQKDFQSSRNRIIHWVRRAISIEMMTKKWRKFCDFC